ncbi:hypothetical protein BHE74_00016698 [Ensete ventricosum]|nr:hypothetical protein BHE74_00016698 [Ensete ventricosum]
MFYRDRRTKPVRVSEKGSASSLTSMSICVFFWVEVSEREKRGNGRWKRIGETKNEVLNWREFWRWVVGQLVGVTDSKRWLFLLLSLVVRLRNPPRPELSSFFGYCPPFLRLLRSISNLQLSCNQGPTVGNRLATDAASSVVQRYLGWMTRGQPKEVDATVTPPEACHALDRVDVMVIQTQNPPAPRYRLRGPHLGPSFSYRSHSIPLLNLIRRGIKRERGALRKRRGLRGIKYHTLRMYPSLLPASLYT